MQYELDFAMIILMKKTQVFCPKCKGTQFWQTNDKRLKCKNCRFLFTPRENPFNVPNETLHQIISEFILEHSTNIILQRVKISKYKLLKILNTLRRMMAEDNLQFFQKNQCLKIEPESPISKTPIIGILAKDDFVFAKILNIEPAELKIFLKNPIEKAEEWMKNFAIAHKSSFYRLLPKQRQEIDVLEVFWGYLKRKLSSKGGIRKEKLPLYLAEYVWRFNHRKLKLKEQEEALLKLILEKS